MKTQQEKINFTIENTIKDIMTLKKLVQDDLFEKALSGALKGMIEVGRLSVLEDFDDVIEADAFFGFTEQEWNAVRKFFKVNTSLRKLNEDFNKDEQ